MYQFWAPIWHLIAGNPRWSGTSSWWLSRVLASGRDDVPTAQRQWGRGSRVLPALGVEARRCWPGLLRGWRPGAATHERVGIASGRLECVAVRAGLSVAAIGPGGSLLALRPSRASRPRRAGCALRAGGTLAGRTARAGNTSGTGRSRRTSRPRRADGARQTRRSALAARSGRALDALARFTAASRRPGHRGFTQPLHLRGQLVTGLVCGAQVVAEALHEDDKEREASQPQGRRYGKGEVSPSMASLGGEVLAHAPAPRALRYTVSNSIRTGAMIAVNANRLSAARRSASFWAS